MLEGFPRDGSTLVAPYPFKWACFAKRETSHFTLFNLPSQNAMDESTEIRQDLPDQLGGRPTLVIKITIYTGRD